MEKIFLITEFCKELLVINGQAWRSAVNMNLGQVDVLDLKQWVAKLSALKEVRYFRRITRSITLI
jgi:hypothetical protein